jgi:methyl acetate hydrolase
MNRVRRIGLCLLAAAIAASVASQASPQPSSRPLDAFLQARVAAGDVPAVVAMVVNRDATLYAGASGATPGSIFRIASMTKPVTSLAAMMLYEQGKLGLDDPIVKYLPEYSKVRVLTAWNDATGTYESRPPVRMITVRDLLTHTSGMTYPFEDARLTKLVSAHVAEADLPLLSDPGMKFSYGPSTAVVGRIVERVSGEPLDVFLRTHVFDPLGMRDTSFSVPPEKRNLVVTVHIRQADGSLRELPNAATLTSAVRGDGGLFSTASDYARFTQLFLNRGRLGHVRLLREQTFHLMTSNQIGTLTITEQPSADPTIARPFPFGAGKDKFGFGFQIEEAPASAGGRGVGSLSWGGIDNTHFWIDPRRSLAAVVLMQLLPYYDERALATLRGFERLVYELPTRSTASGQPRS